MAKYSLETNETVFKTESLVGLDLCSKFNYYLYTCF